MLVWFILLFSLSVSLAAGKVIDGFPNPTDTIEWPAQYTVRATKLSLTSNFVENFVVWRSTTRSRVDLNDGVVKIFGKRLNGKVHKYEVHTVTDKQENIKHKCDYLNTLNPDDDMLLDNILPDLKKVDFKTIGIETVNDIDALRFESTDECQKDGTVYVFWAIYNDEFDFWQPIRYDKKNYNVALGSLTTHEIWEFSEFEIDFDEHELFIKKRYHCHRQELNAKTPNSDVVINEPTFITDDMDNEDHIFNSFKKRFNRKYAHEEEHNLRKNVIKKNMRLISSVNSKNLGYKLTINQFADRTPEEMKKRTGLKKRNKGKTSNIPFPYSEKELKSIVDELPTSVDLRNEGLVGPVLDQGECGSCWSFSTTAAVEGALARSNGGRFMRLSNQALVDCAWGFGALGCSGGFPSEAYEWMMKYGLPTEQDYGSYESLDGVCHNEKMTSYPIKGYTEVTPLSYAALKVAVFNHGPLSVLIDTTDEFSLYSSGIYYDTKCNSSDLGHAVALVGYGEQNGELFWILKNSWGVNWGMDGYMLISAKDNNCGVASDASYVVV